MDREGWYSVTPEARARHIAERCRGYRVVIDAFAGVGGNTIQFALVCDKVIAIDIDARRLECARHNARVYGVEDKIEFICGDYIQLLPRLRADVVFLSPPWGGPKYLKQPTFDLRAIQVSDPPIDGVQMFYETVRHVTRNVVYFLPRNIDADQILALSEGTLDRPRPKAKKNTDNTQEFSLNCELEANCINDKVKTRTAYFGDIARTA
eukprot:TRINITY_DN12766_c0_g1::TRINITY_DN12766_c0_g1_i1::g.28594::m.28594 TRINITY_DN12766_c0_g1::TRINITY_DN12766_c0_g1_i1::g.28594  ORF type:complete len:208 (-),score=47.16,sp/Q923W1/TGS1_MOUSE/50.48/2e-58,Methyltransf_15/PF09445.5/3e-45,Methyltransf_26/PF13659.1/2.7e-11,UPF0020/PF01170.13/2.5e-09,Met_10/PF02475.11/4.4e-08,Methyltransf_31/PF13847.1/6.5e-08,Methyltransf_18/PF12847.2/2.8e-07,MTS/PF05175.9/5.2e-05,Methyltransf_25/PF13649.1/0.00016,Cons_hypoth95/PF03602.10/9.9e-05,Methyltransf_3/PF01596.12